MANEFIARNGIISKSNLVVSGSLTALNTITAQTLVVQTVTSSISSITGSTNFGSLSSNTHTFTGSILASGSVGIGTNSPSGELHVKAYSGFSELYVQGASSTSGIYLFDNNTESGLWKVDSGYMAFATTNTERMRITSGGNVGIGNSNPSDYYNTILAIGNPSSAATGFTMASTSTGASAIWFARGSSGADRYRASFAYNQSDDNFYWRLAGDALRMTLTGAGNLGIGVTPSAWDTTIFKGLQVANSNAFVVGRVDAASQLQMGTNTYYNADGNWKFIQNGYATRYIQNGGVHSWEYSNASGTAGNNVTFNEAMRITEVGNIGIGTIAPQSILDGFSSSARGMAISNSYPFIGLKDTDGGSLFLGTQANLGYLWNGGTDLIFGAGNVERMRITSGGKVYINTTTDLPGSGTIFHVYANDACVAFANNNTGQQVLLLWNKGTSGNNLFQEFATETGITGRGSIDFNRAAGLVRYNTTSDANLKNIIGDSDLEKSINILNSTKIKEFSWKEDKTNKPQIGVIAQELYETYKGAVSVGSNESLLGTEDYKFWKVDKTAFTFHLIAGWQKHEQLIQEQQAQIQELTARITELENK